MELGCSAKDLGVSLEDPRANSRCDASNSRRLMVLTGCVHPKRAEGSDYGAAVALNPNLVTPNTEGFSAALVPKPKTTQQTRKLHHAYSRQY